MIEEEVETRALSARAGGQRDAAGVDGHRHTASPDGDPSNVSPPFVGVVRPGAGGAFGGVAELERELYRSRRYGRTLGLIGHPLRSSEHVARLRSLVRAGDYVWSDGVGTVYILAPECGLEAVEGLIGRVGQVDPGALDPDSARVALFPDDALTGEALVAAVTVPPEERADAFVDACDEPAPLFTRLMRVVRGSSATPEFGDTTLSL